ncbi:MAG: 50S ribosomal protein L10 [Chloroflexi bacterium]|nr:50S ribosomal protein L10 [Chloroflexota bacterium]
MAISKQRKTNLVAEYIEQLEQSQGIILTDYRGLSVNDISNIRRAMRPIGGKFQVVKNRLMILALKEMGISLPEEWLIGPTAIGFCHDEVPPVAKSLTNASKELETLHIKGGMLDRSVIEAAQVWVIANLPSREVLFAQVLGTINAPATQVAGVVAGGIRQVLNVLQAHVDKLQESVTISGAGLEQAPA